MHNDIETRDPFVTRLFEANQRELAAKNFPAQVLARLEHAQRVRCAVAIAVLLAATGIVALVAPWIAPTLSAFDAASTMALGTTGALTGKPLSWILAVAILLACLPVLYVWRLWRP